MAAYRGHCPLCAVDFPGVLADDAGRCTDCQDESWRLLQKRDAMLAHKRVAS